MNTLYGNHMVDGADAELDRMDRESDHRDHCAEALKTELIDAMQRGDAAVKIRTPAWPSSTSTLDEILGDELCANDERWKELVALIGYCMRSKDAAVRYPAMALAAKVAEKHARLHVDDLVAQDVPIPMPTYRRHIWQVAR